MKAEQEVASCQFPVASHRLSGNRQLATGNSKRSAFTLIEMLTTVAILVIVLGLMVSLARHVREDSAQLLTKLLLKQLDNLMAQYMEHNAAQVPQAELLLPNERVKVPPEESALALLARKNNEQTIRALKLDYWKHLPHDTGEPAPDPFTKASLPMSVYDLQTVRDAWGSPIVFMPRQHELIGLAPSRAGQDQFFFFSAGPDRKFLTRDDNLYSYEAARGQ